MDAATDIDALLGVNVPHADYLAAVGRGARIARLDAAGAGGGGTLREVGAAARGVAGFESFWLCFAIDDPVPAQALYRVEIEGLPPHALLLVPSARHGATTEYHASFNRQPA